MRVRLWGTRGSLPCPGPDWAEFGGNTSCVEVVGDDPEALLVLDAGTGIVGLGRRLAAMPARIDILLTHLHMDHIIGLGFFGPLFDPASEIHIWGPSSTAYDLRERLTRYLSPPLFPVRLRDLPCRLHIHDVPLGEQVSLPGLKMTAALVCHPGASVGYRLTSSSAAIAYLPDHEPALGVVAFPGPAPWTSGFDLASAADLVIHDAQYSEGEYATRVGWGHSTIEHAVAFARHVEARRLVAFHHDPAHDDAWIRDRYATLDAGDVVVDVAREGLELTL